MESREVLEESPADAGWIDPLDRFHPLSPEVSTHVMWVYQYLMPPDAKASGINVVTVMERMYRDGWIRQASPRAYECAIKSKSRVVDWVLEHYSNLREIDIDLHNDMGAVRGVTVNIEDYLHLIGDSLDTVQSWSWIKTGKFLSIADFHVGEDRYAVEIVKGPDDQGYHNVVLKSLDWRGKGNVMPTDRGHPFPVLATMVDILKSFVHEHPDTTLRFEPSDLKLMGVYSRLIKRAGLEVETDPLTPDFFVVHLGKNQDLSTRK